MVTQERTLNRDVTIQQSLPRGVDCGCFGLPGLTQTG
jgi:hypothetical protein